MTQPRASLRARERRKCEKPVIRLQSLSICQLDTANFLFQFENFLQACVIASQSTISSVVLANRPHRLVEMYLLLDHTTIQTFDFYE